MDPLQVRPQVRLTFGHTLGQVDLWSDVPPRQSHLVAKCNTTSGQVDIGQIFGSGSPLFRCMPRQRHHVVKCDTTLGQVNLWSDVHQGEASCGQVCYYFGQVDLWSDVPPCRDILWPSVLWLWSGCPLIRSLGQVDLWSDVPSGRGILWPSVLLLQSGWPLVRCTHMQQHLVAKCVMTLDRLTFDQRKFPWAETFCGQVWYYFRSGWHLIGSLDQVDLWSDVPLGRDILWPSVLLLWSDVLPGRNILWPSVLWLWSGWPLVRCTLRQRYLVANCVTTLVRLTFGQMSPLAETSCGQVCYYFGQVDLWSEEPLGRDISWPSVLLLQVRLTFDRIFGLGWPLVRCAPRQRHLVAKCVMTLVRLTFDQMYP